MNPVDTKVRRGVVGRSPQEQLRSTWQRFGPGGGHPAFLPWDAESCDAALLQGLGVDVVLESEEGQALLDAFTGQGARLPSQRRFAARRTAEAEGVLLTAAEVEKLDRLKRDGLNAIE